jgi:hypothetical protein
MSGRRSVSWVIVCLTFLSGAVGCGVDPTSQPEKPPVDIIKTDSGMVMSHVELDTLYWGETTRLIGKDFGTDASALKLFIRTSEFRVLSAADSALEIEVPDGVRTGQFRLYRNDSQAVGNVTLTVLPRHASDPPSSVYNTGPREGYGGEQFIVTGSRLDVRKRDARVRIGDRELRIDSLREEAVYCMLPDDIADGEISVTIFGQQFDIGSFKVLKHGDRFLPEGKFSQVSLEMIVRARVSGNVQIIEEENDQEMNVITLTPSIVHVPHPEVFVQRQGDSIFYSDITRRGTDTVYLHFRLFQPKGMNTLSGMVKMRRSYRVGGKWETVALTAMLDSVPFRGHNHFSFPVISSPIISPGKIRLIEYESRSLEAGFEQWLKMEEMLPMRFSSMFGRHHITIRFGG